MKNQKRARRDGHGKPSRDVYPIHIAVYGWYNHSEEIRDELIISRDKPYFWWINPNNRIENMWYFICEKTFEQQHLRTYAYNNYLVGDLHPP